MRKVLPLAILFLISFGNCRTIQSIIQTEPTESVEVIPIEDRLPPIVSGEDMMDENGEIVFNHKNAPEYFQAPSKDPYEYFRVIISSDDYFVRQIRGSKLIQRKPDIGGDELVKEEIGNFNVKDMQDEGILLLTLNGNTGGIEVVNFDRRVPRINGIAKIIQNDVIRWQFLHELRDDRPQITKFKVYYRIILQKTLTREQIKEKFFNKK